MMTASTSSAASSSSLEVALHLVVHDECDPPVAAVAAMPDSERGRSDQLSLLHGEAEPGELVERLCAGMRGRVRDEAQREPRLRRRSTASRAPAIGSSST